MKWLAQANLYLMKACKLAEVAGNENSGLFQQRKDCEKVVAIIKSLFSYMGRPVAEMKSVTGLLL